jgi:hypothetical protein
MTFAVSRSRLAVSAGANGPEILLAAAAFAVLCIAVLSVGPQLMEPDDYAYRASILAITQGHLLTLSTAQAHALTAQLSLVGPHARLAGTGGGGALSIAVAVGAAAWRAVDQREGPGLPVPGRAVPGARGHPAGVVPARAVGPAAPTGLRSGFRLVGVLRYGAGR